MQRITNFLICVSMHYLCPLHFPPLIHHVFCSLRVLFTLVNRISVLFVKVYPILHAIVAFYVHSVCPLWMSLHVHKILC